MLGNRVQSRKSNGNAFNGCGLFNLRGCCLAVRLGAVCTRKGAPSSCFRLESVVSVFPSFLRPRQSLLSLRHLSTLGVRREKRPTKSSTFVVRASLDSPLHPPSARFLPLPPQPPSLSCIHPFSLATNHSRFCYCLTIVPLLPRCVGPLV